MTRGLYVLLVGPTAVGKDTVLRILRERLPKAAKPVNATTRSPRPGEIDGTHFHFLSEEEFRRRIAKGDFLEWNEFGTGKLYGSVRSDIEELLAQGRLVLNIVDVNGARSTRRALPETAVVFLMPESPEQLERQIRKGVERQGLTGEEVSRRLATALMEMAAADEFDIVVMNREGAVDSAADEIQAFIERRLVRQDP